MSRFSHNQLPPHLDPRYGMPPVRQLQRRRRWRPRWNFLWVLLAIMGAAWFLSGVDLAFEWVDVMDALDVRNRERFTSLCIVGLILITIAALVRVTKGMGGDRK